MNKTQRELEPGHRVLKIGDAESCLPKGLRSPGTVMRALPDDYVEVRWDEMGSEWPVLRKQLKLHHDSCYRDVEFEDRDGFHSTYSLMYDQKGVTLQHEDSSSPLFVLEGLGWSDAQIYEVLKVYRLACDRGKKLGAAKLAAEMRRLLGCVSDTHAHSADR